MAIGMTYYIEAYERVKVLKKEYENELGKWLKVCDGTSSKKDIITSFRDVKYALKKLDDASWELLKILDAKYKFPRDFVVRTLTT
jgi:hypothetical protein